LVFVGVAEEDGGDGGGGEAADDGVKEGLVVGWVRGVKDWEKEGDKGEDGLGCLPMGLVVLGCLRDINTVTAELGKYHKEAELTVIARQYMRNNPGALSLSFTSHEFLCEECQNTGGIWVVKMPVIVDI